MHNLIVRDMTSIARLTPAGAGALYTCPMHAQIRRVAPGNCTICGMTLESVKAKAEPGENHEHVDLVRRFWVGLILTLPVFALEMGGIFLDLVCIILSRRTRPSGFNLPCPHQLSCGQDGLSLNARGRQS